MDDKALKGKYNDIRLFLVLIPFINALNYYLTYTPIIFNSHTIITFFIDTTEGYAAWCGIRFVIIYLDKKIPYESNPLKRILIQLVLSSVVGLMIIIGLTELINFIVKDRPVPSSFYQFDIFIFLIWFFVINGIYVGLHYYQAMKQLEKQNEKSKKIRTEGFSVKDGRQNLILSFDSIAGFFSDEDYTAVVTIETKKYLLDTSLDKIAPTLPGELFFRLNRQFILHRNTVKGFVKAENGKLTVILIPTPHFPEQVNVSRTKAAEFKNWFSPE